MKTYQITYKVKRHVSGEKGGDTTIEITVSEDVANPYEALDLSPSATDQEIQAKYRKLSKQYHPDPHNGKGDIEKLKLVNAAYDVLKDPDKKASFDAQLILEQSRAQRSRNEQSSPPPRAPKEDGQPRYQEPPKRPEEPRQKHEQQSAGDLEYERIKTQIDEAYSEASLPTAERIRYKKFDQAKTNQLIALMQDKRLDFITNSINEAYSIASLPSPIRFQDLLRTESLSSHGYRLLMVRLQGKHFDFQYDLIQGCTHEMSLPSNETLDAMFKDNKIDKSQVDILKAKVLMRREDFLDDSIDNATHPSSLPSLYSLDNFLQSGRISKTAHQRLYRRIQLRHYDFMMNKILDATFAMSVPTQAQLQMLRKENKITDSDYEVLLRASENKLRQIKQGY